MYVASLTNQNVIQMAYVVEDLEEAAHRFIKTLGVGPFYINDRPKISDALYRQEFSKVEFSTAITQAGGVQLELVQQHCDSPSCYRDTVSKGQEAFHHIAIFADDYDGELTRYQSLGIEIASSGRMGPMRFSYVDTQAQIMAMTEVLESKPFIHEYFENLKTACLDWDGTNPIRSASDLF